MPRTGRTRIALALAVAVGAIACAPISNASAQTVTTPTVCPSTFDVLHDDSIGSLSLPAGAYTITVANPSRLTCADASHLFAEFLEDFDGVLTRPWRLNASTATFTRGGGISFSVAQSTPTPPTPPTPPSNRVCPSSFTVLHNDHVGSLSIPKGRYRITLLSVGRISCAQASNFLAQFLQDFDGVLPSPWFVDPTTASFMRGSRFVGFRIKPWSGSGGGGGGGGSTTARCGGTFRVLHNDQIGNLILPKGPYYVTAFGNVSCKQASAQFTSFLDNDYTGALPRPWTLQVQNGQFNKGSSRNGFRVKPAR